MDAWVALCRCKGQMLDLTLFMSGTLVVSFCKAPGEIAFQMVSTRSALVELEDELEVTRQLARAAYMAAGDLSEDVVGPMRSLLDVIARHLEHVSDRLTAIREKSKADLETA
jgi:hypothetical protein